MTNGLYRYSRNPQYVASILGLFGAGLANGEIPHGDFAGSRSSFTSSCLTRRSRGFSELTAMSIAPTRRGRRAFFEPQAPRLSGGRRALIVRAQIRRREPASLIAFDIETYPLPLARRADAGMLEGADVQNTSFRRGPSQRLKPFAALNHLTVPEGTRLFLGAFLTPPPSVALAPRRLADFCFCCRPGPLLAPGARAQSRRLRQLRSRQTACP